MIKMRDKCKRFRSKQAKKYVRIWEGAAHEIGDGKRENEYLLNGFTFLLSVCCSVMPVKFCVEEAAMFHVLKKLLAVLFKATSTVSIPFDP